MGFPGSWCEAHCEMSEQAVELVTCERNRRVGVISATVDAAPLRRKCLCDTCDRIIIRHRLANLRRERPDLLPLVTHQFALDDIAEAFALFSEQRGGVLKVALYPDGVPHHRRMLEAVGAGALDREC